MAQKFGRRKNTGSQRLFDFASCLTLIIIFQPKKKVPNLLGEGGRGVQLKLKQKQPNYMGLCGVASGVINRFEKRAKWLIGFGFFGVDFVIILSIPNSVSRKLKWRYNFTYRRSKNVEQYFSIYRKSCMLFMLTGTGKRNVTKQHLTARNRCTLCT